MKKNVFNDKTLEEKLKVLVNSIKEDNDYISIGGINYCILEEQRKYYYMAEIYNRCLEYVRKNYVPYVISMAAYTGIYIEYNGIKYEISETYPNKDNIGYIFEKARIKYGLHSERVCCEGLILSIKGNDVITSFVSDKVLNDTRNYFDAKKETLELLSKFKKNIIELSKIGLSQDQIIELIYHINDKDSIDESSYQYYKVFMYITKKKDNRN